MNINIDPNIDTEMDIKIVNQLNANIDTEARFCRQIKRINIPTAKYTVNRPYFINNGV